MKTRFNFGKNYIPKHLYITTDGLQKEFFPKRKRPAERTYITQLLRTHYGTSKHHSLLTFIKSNYINAIEVYKQTCSFKIDFLDSSLSNSEKQTIILNGQLKSTRIINQGGLV